MLNICKILTNHLSLSKPLTKRFVFNDALTHINNLKGHLINNDVHTFGSKCHSIYKDAWFEGSGKSASISGPRLKD